MFFVVHVLDSLNVQERDNKHSGIFTLPIKTDGIISFPNLKYNAVTCIPIHENIMLPKP